MTKDAENKMSMHNALGAALVKTKDSVGEKFDEVYRNAFREELEKRKAEYEEELTTRINGILGELSRIKVLNDELDRIDETLRVQED